MAIKNKCLIGYSLYFVLATVNLDMELKIGLKFKKYYGDNNINNIASCEVRGIVDDYIIVLWCKKDANKMSEAKEFYLSIDKHDFDFNVKNEVYLPL